MFGSLVVACSAVDLHLTPPRVVAEDVLLPRIGESVDGLSDYYDTAELRKYRNTAAYRVGILRRL